MYKDVISFSKDQYRLLVGNAVVTIDAAAVAVDAVEVVPVVKAALDDAVFWGDAAKTKQVL